MQLSDTLTAKRQPACSYLLNARLARTAPTSSSSSSSHICSTCDAPLSLSLLPQAFRHLYALAAEPRCLEALDVHSRRQVVVPLAVTAHTAGLAGAAAAHAHKQQQQQQQQQQQRSVLKQWQQPTPAVGLSGAHAATAATAGGLGGEGGLSGPQQQQDSAGGDDAMVCSPRSADKAARPGLHGHAASAAVPSGGGGASGQVLLPPPAFSTGGQAGPVRPRASGSSGQQQHSAMAVTPPLKPGLPPFSPAGAAAAPTADSQGAGAAAAAAAAADGGCSSREGNSDIITLRLQAPCLLPERKHLVSLRVCGPRYWPVQVASAAAAAGQPGGSSTSGSSSSSSWSDEYRICVKKKAGSLSYTDDQTGVKSLLFKAFYAGGSDSILASAATAGLQAGGDGSNSEAAAGGQQQQTATGSRQQQQSFDIMHLCQTFAADPQIQAFAQVLQAANTAAAAADGNSASSSSSSSSRRFLSFCNGALYECVVQEKTSTLPAYLQLYSLVHRACAAAAVMGPAAGVAGAAGVSATASGTSSGSCSSSAAVLGAPAPVGPGLLLQDLMMSLSCYGSSTAVAAGLCRTALHREVSGAAAAGATASGALQQQQQQHVEPGEVDVLMWQPLLQPGFCNSLYSTLIQFWRAAGVVPSRSLSEVSCSNRGSLQGPASMLARFISQGKITAVAAEGSAEGSVPASLLDQSPQVLGSCLAALQLPPAAPLQALRVAWQQQQQQQQGQQGEVSGMGPLLQLIAGMGDVSAGQDVPPDSLMILAAALQEASVL